MKSPKKPSNISYIHFLNLEETEEFVNNVKKLNYQIYHRCCGGRGVGVKTEDYNNLLVLSLEHNKLEKMEECCVCFMETHYLTNCNHCLCINCNLKIVNKLCPICRKDL